MRSFFYRPDFKPDSPLSISRNASLNNCACAPSSVEVSYLSDRLPQF